VEGIEYEKTNKHKQIHTNRHARKIQGTNMNELEEPEVGMVMFSIGAFPVRWGTDLLQKPKKEKRKEKKRKKKVVECGGDMGM
jgi:hypothetical protein